MLVLLGITRSLGEGPETCLFQELPFPQEAWEKPIEYRDLEFGKNQISCHTAIVLAMTQSTHLRNSSFGCNEKFACSMFTRLHLVPESIHSTGNGLVTFVLSQKCWMGF